MKVTYLLGAGASAGKPLKESPYFEKDERYWRKIGLPVVNEIPDRLKKLVDDIRHTTLSGKVGELDYGVEQKKLIKDLEELLEKCQRHATIDTYAKKLVLTKNTFSLLHLENILCFYLICEQLFNKIDNRYDTFFANVLGDNLLIPPDMNIVSWNYDNYLDMAYYEYQSEQQIRTITKNNVREENPKVFKINGTATFENYTLRNLLEDSKKTYYGDIDSDNGLEIGLTHEGLKRIVEIYYHVCAYTPKNHSHLSFAFDTVHNTEQKFYEKLRKTLQGTDILVVIGYTFPFFNRQIDQIILSALLDIKKVYIQDINPTKTQEILQTILTEEGSKATIIPITDVSSFFIPPEFTIPHKSGGILDIVGI